MKKINLRFVLVFFVLSISSFVVANEIDLDKINSTEIKKQCEFIVYGKGNSNELVNAFMFGVISGRKQNIYPNEETYFSKNSSLGEILKASCKAAFITPYKAKGIFYLDFVLFGINDVMVVPK